MCLGMLHVYVEGLLCFKTIVSPSLANIWGKRYTMYFCGNAFIGLALWQPLNVFSLAITLILPVDTLTLSGAVAIMSRHPVCSRPWLFGLMWAFNCPIVACIFGLIVWNAHAPNNYTGATTLLLQLQYVAMGIFLIPLLGNSNKVGNANSQPKEIMVRAAADSSEDPATNQNKLVPAPLGGVQWTPCEPQTVTETPDPNPDSNSRCRLNWKHVLMLTVGLLGLETLLTLVLPLAMGKVLLLELFTNPCNSFLPGSVVHGDNFGPHYIYPHDCSDVLP